MQEDDVKRLRTRQSTNGQGRHFGDNAGATWGASTEDHPSRPGTKLMNPQIRPCSAQPAIGTVDDSEQIRPHHQSRIVLPASWRQWRYAMIAYHTSKGSVVNFTRALAGDWGARDYRQRARTSSSSEMTKGTPRGGWRDKLAASAPLRRIGARTISKAPRSCSQAMPANTSRQILAIDGVRGRLAGARSKGGPMRVRDVP